MKISSFRSILYTLAKFLGDFQAGRKAVKKNSSTPILKRIGRRLYGRGVSRGFHLFK